MHGADIHSAVLGRTGKPRWPFEYTVGGVALTPNDADNNGTAHTDEPVVWIGEGRQVGYLPGIAANALGWS